MALKSQSSRRYALALVEAATKTGDIEKTQKELSRFAGAVESSFDLKNSLLNPVFTADERKKVLSAMIEQMRLSDLVRRFLELLVDRGRISGIAEIAEAFHALADERRGRVRAEVHSAAQLAPEATDRLKRALEKHTGKTIELDLKVDPDLLGGLKARVGSIVFDGTIRSELERLREILTRTD